MRNRDDGAFKVVQEALQPGDRFGVQVVRWFVQQQHVWFFQQQAAEGDATTFTTGKGGDFRVPVRQAQRIGSTFQLGIQVVTIVSLDDLFQTALFSGQFVEVCIFFSIERIDFVETLQCANDF